MIRSSIWEIKAQGCLIQTNFHEDATNMICMSLNHFQALIACSKEPTFTKARWNHGLLSKHGHACEELWTTTSKLQYIYMHATIKLQHNNLSHKLALDLNLALNHARIILITLIGGWTPYLSLELKVWRLNLQFSSKTLKLPSKLPKNKSILSLSISWSARALKMWLMKSLPKCM